MKIKHNKIVRFALFTAFTLFAANSCTQGDEAAETYKAALVGSPSLNVGKSVFQVKITDAAGQGLSGLNPLIVPTMDMGTMVHTTPVDTTVDNGNGTYTVTAYFLMASMGHQWYLKFYESTGSQQFAPAITITVGGMSTARVSISSSNDQYSNMETATNRPYFVFIDEITESGGQHTVKVFAAVRKSMTAHPSLTDGLELLDATGNTWVVDKTKTKIELSIDDGSTWLTPLTDHGEGHYSIDNVSGLSAGLDKKLTFKITVNDVEIGTGSLNATVP